MNEKFERVSEFVRENLVNDWRPFFLNLSGGGKVSILLISFYTVHGNNEHFIIIILLLKSNLSK